MSVARIFSRSGMTSCVTLLLNVIGGVLAARLLGVEGRGLLGVLVFWPQFIADVLRPPFSDAIVMLSRTPDQNGTQSRLAVTYTRRAIVYSIVFSICAIPVMLLGVGIFAKDRLGEFWLAACVFGAVYLFSTFIAQAFQGYIRTTGYFGMLNVTRISIPAIYVTCAAGLALGGAGLIGFVVAQVVSRATVFVGQTIFIMHHLSKQIVGHSMEMRQTVSKLWGANIAAILASNIDRALVMITAETVWIGAYLVAMTLATPLNGLVSTMLQSVGLPQLLTLGRSARDAAYEKLIRITLTTSVVSAATIVLSAPITLPLLFGSEFKMAIWLTIGLSLAFILTPVRMAMRPILLAENKTNVLIWTEVLFIVTFALVFGVLHWTVSFSPLLPALGAANALVVLAQWRLLKLTRPSLSAWRAFIVNFGTLSEMLVIVRSGIGRAK